MDLRRSCYVLGCAGIVTIAVAPASWAQTKIGFIDSGHITENYKEFQEARKEAQRYERELTREYNKKQDEFEKMKENFERQSLLMSDGRKREEEQALGKKQQELQRWLDEVTGPEGKLSRKNQELLEPVLRKVNLVIERVAKESDYDFVLNSAAIAYGNEAYDLTQKVMEVLQKELEAEAKKAGSATER